MKKIVLTAAVFALTVSSAFSQNFKPKEKEIAVGIAFDSPFSSGKPFSLVNGVSGRYFYKSDLAFRGTINLGSASSSKTEYYLPAGKEDKEVDYVSKSSNFDLKMFLGAEKHFLGTDRLDPYAGADLIVGFGSESTKNTPERDLIDTKIPDGLLSSKQGNSTFGLRAVLGADYYVLPKMYIGTEFGITYQRVSKGDQTDVNIDFDKDGKAIEKETVSPSDSFGSAGSIFTDMTTAAFRIGFRF